MNAMLAFELHIQRIKALPAGQRLALVPESVQPEDIRWSPGRDTVRDKAKRAQRDKRRRYEAKQKALRQACAIQAARELMEA